MKKNMNCLQYCKSGMSDRLFEFASTSDGKHMIELSKMLGQSRDEQIREYLIAVNSFFMVQGAIKVLGIPKTDDGALGFMLSESFQKLHDEVVSTVQGNFKTLMDCLNPKQKLRLNALFA